MTHTPEPWRLCDGRIIQTSHITRDVWEIPHQEGDLERIVACVNALSGLNPAGVKGLVEAAENALNEFEERFELTSPTTNPGIKYTANELRTAIANLKGTQ